MIIPVRCFTCGKVLGHQYEKYVYLTSKESSPERVSEALKLLDMKRYCCRRVIMSTVPLIDKLMKYN
jgi:DNA-directed RNA polymerase I, II, and III subunit RPABC5